MVAAFELDRQVRPAEVEEQFGGLLIGRSSYGAPPHGGMAAFGIDRIVMLIWPSERRTCGKSPCSR